MKKNVVYRNFDIENLDTTDEHPGRITGKPVLLGVRSNLGPFDEVIEPGALDACDMKDVRLCLNHDTSYVYARSRNGKGTMRLNRGLKGVEIEADLAVNDSPKAQDFYTAVKRGDISGMSFMFAIADDAWEDTRSEHPLHRIKAIDKIYEVSAVTFPAYPQTEIEARDLQAALDSARAALDEAEEERDLETPDGAIEAAQRRDAAELLKLKWLYR